LGAPQALQVADRFHLFCNMTQALQRVLLRLAAILQHVQLSASTPDDVIGRASGAGDAAGQKNRGERIDYAQPACTEAQQTTGEAEGTV
jgi:hypothetical protein